MSKGPPAPAPEITAYAVVHKQDSTYALQTLRIKGSTVTGKTESETDSLAATLGRLATASMRQHTT